MKTFGKTVSAARKAQQLKVYELANKINVVAVYISQIERQQKLPSYKVMRRIERVLKLSLEHLYLNECIRRIKAGR